MEFPASVYPIVCKYVTTLNQGDWLSLEIQTHSSFSIEVCDTANMTIPSATVFQFKEFLFDIFNSNLSQI